MRNEQDMIKLFDEARISGKTFDEALEISGYKAILSDEQAVEDFREMIECFDKTNELLDEFKNHPEWDREMLTPLREKLEEVNKTSPRESVCENYIEYEYE